MLKFSWYNTKRKISSTFPKRNLNKKKIEYQLLTTTKTLSFEPIGDQTLPRGDSRRLDNLGLRERRRLVQGGDDRHRLHHARQVRLRRPWRSASRVHLRDGYQVRRGDPATTGPGHPQHLRRLPGEQARTAQRQDHRLEQHGQEAVASAAALQELRCILLRVVWIDGSSVYYWR